MPACAREKVSVTVNDASGAIRSLQLFTNKIFIQNIKYEFDHLLILWPTGGVTLITEVDTAHLHRPLVVGHTKKVPLTLWCREILKSQKLRERFVI